MQKIVLISGSGQQRTQKSSVRELYTGRSFRANLETALELVPERKIFVLSAKFGLLRLDEQVPPHDDNLAGLSDAQLRRWANGVLYQLAAQADLEQDQFILLAAPRYRKYLLPALKQVEVPAAEK